MLKVIFFDDCFPFTRCPTPKGANSEHVTPVQIHQFTHVQQSRKFRTSAALWCSKTEFRSGALLRACCRRPSHRRCFFLGYCRFGFAAALLRGGASIDLRVAITAVAAGRCVERRKCALYTASVLGLRLLAHYILDLGYFSKVFYVLPLLL